MRATLMYGAGDVRVETVPDARLIEPTDALVRVTRSAICGSDLWPYKSMEPTETGRRTGHEFIGVVEDVGYDVRTMKKGDLVVTPFVWSDGTCFFCRQGLHVSCLHGGRYGFDGVDGGQDEAARAPQADGTLVVLPVSEEDTLLGGFGETRHQNGFAKVTSTMSPASRASRMTMAQIAHFIWASCPPGRSSVGLTRLSLRRAARNNEGCYAASGMVRARESASDNRPSITRSACSRMRSILRTRTKANP